MHRDVVGPAPLVLHIPPLPAPPPLVADSLIYETTHLITEDYPPGNEQDVLLRYGDRIVEVRGGGAYLVTQSVTHNTCHNCHYCHLLQINGQCVHGLNTHQIDELFRKDDTVTLTVTPKTKAS